MEYRVSHNIYLCLTAGFIVLVKHFLVILEPLEGFLSDRPAKIKVL